jgi:hypothetical protein
MLNDILSNIKERLANQPDSRCASADEVRICWLIGEIDRLKQIERHHVELIEIKDWYFECLEMDEEDNYFGVCQNSQACKEFGETWHQAEAALREYVGKTNNKNNQTKESQK